MLATGDVEHPGDKKTASRPSLNTPLQSPACIQHLSESLFRKTPVMVPLVYDGVFEVLQWLLFLSAVPPVQLLTGWCVTAKALPDISAISALTAVKHGNCSSLTPLLNPVRTRKSLIWP